MEGWGPRTYGQPCRECGFDWETDVDDCEASIAGLSDRLRDRLSGATGSERHPDLAWSVTAYVAHVGDNLRIFAERLAGIARGASPLVASYDENELARARVYAQLDLRAVLWSLDRSVRDWLDAVTASPPDLVMDHPQRGLISLADIVRSNAHDAQHHEWDITRTMTRLEPRSDQSMT